MASPGQFAAHDASSVASGVQSGASVGTGIGEDSMSAMGAGEDMQSLRQMVTTQQQRIEFLENMHQQALRQLRKSRDEMAKAHQQRFFEADRVLRLEQLVSEMQ